MWIYQGKEITCLEDIPEEHRNSYGFIYNIVSESGREYIGSKVLKHSVNRIVGKRELLKKGKKAFRKRKSKTGKKKGEWIYYEDLNKESDWVTYTGSSDELNKDIKNGVEVTKYILEFVEKKGHLLYRETKNIMCTNALEEEKFYNQHAIKKFYKKNIMK